MAAKYILAALAVGFLAAGLVRVSGAGNLSHPQARAWLLIGVIFAAITAWLWSAT